MRTKRLFQTTLFKKFSTQEALRRSEKYSNTLLQPIINLKNTLPHRDVTYVAFQNQRWTVKELDGHSEAFANYLVENGFSSGSKILFWTDINHTTENIAGLIGSLKAGLTVVNTEFENWEDIRKALLDSGADILVVSPYVNIEKNINRIDEILKDIPELNTVQYGDYMKSSKFPNLKQIIQISHKSIPGTQKFKHCLNYSKLFMNQINLPDISGRPAFEIYSDKDVRKLSHNDCLSKIEEFTANTKFNYSTIINSAPLIYPANLCLGLLGGISTKSYTVFPGSYNFHNIIKNIEMNKSENLVCEDSLLDIQLNKEKLQEIRKTTELVKQISVITNEESLKQKNISTFKEIFVNANLDFYKDSTFSKI